MDLYKHISIPKEVEGLKTMRLKWCYILNFRISLIYFCYIGSLVSGGLRHSISKYFLKFFKKSIITVQTKLSNLKNSSLTVWNVTKKDLYI